MGGSFCFWFVSWFWVRQRFGRKRAGRRLYDPVFIRIQWRCRNWPGRHYWCHLSIALHDPEISILSKGIDIWLCIADPHQFALVDRTILWYEYSIRQVDE